MAKQLTTHISWRKPLSISSTTGRFTSTPIKPTRRNLFGFGSGSNTPHGNKNRIYPNTIRREEELQTLVLMSASSRVPLITMWMTNWCPTCKTLSPLMRKLIETERVGEAEGGVSFVEVEMDSPEMGGVSGLALRYGINAIPTLLAFDRQEPQIETKVSRGEELRSREFLAEWIRTEAARQGTGGAGGTFGKFLGR